VTDRERFGHCCLDPGAEVDQPAGILAAQACAQGFRFDDGVEGAAISDVETDGAETGNVDAPVAEVDEGRHVLERGADERPVGEMRLCDDLATRRFEPDRERAVRPAGLRDKAGQRDDRMAAHRAVAFVMQEEDVEVGGFRRRDHRAIHVGVAARLEHQRRAQVIAIRAEPAAFFQHIAVGHTRYVGDDDAQRLAAGVHVDRVDAQPVSGRLP
jgi:hypothetical protein